MDDTDLVLEVLSALRTALSMPVDTDGKDDLELPSVVLEEVAVTRLPFYHGHKTWAGTTTDAQGTENGNEYHLYWEVTLDAVVRSTSETERDDTLAAIAAAFIPYEDAPQLFHPECHSVQVGRAGRRSLLLREPDWFQGGRSLSFVILQRVTDTAEAIQAIQQTIDPSYDAP